MFTEYELGLMILFGALLLCCLLACLRWFCCVLLCAPCCHFFGRAVKPRESVRRPTRLVRAATPRDGVFVADPFTYAVT